MTTREKPGAEDFVDPAAGDTMRLSRRNILALVLTVAGVILALFFSSRRTPAPRRADPIPDRGTVAPITIGGPDLMPPAPEAAPASGTSAGRRTSMKRSAPGRWCMPPAQRPRRK